MPKSSAAQSSPPEPVAPPAPRRRGRSLADGVVEGMGQRIRDRALRPGDKLPTEAAIMAEWGVSRTVVREAISKLQAAGLVETRHGIGTFVLEPASQQAFRLEAAELATAVDVLAVLELRISLETEAAALAAQRRTDEQLRQMRKALDEISAGEGAQGDSVASDFRFHHLIAESTGNRYFADIMAHLGGMLIPRARINSARLAREDLPQYMRRLALEHEAIHDAIARQDAESARAAMRLHLTNSRERLRRAQAQAAGSAAA